MSSPCSTAISRALCKTARLRATDVGAAGDLLGEPGVIEWSGGAPDRSVTSLRETLMDYPSLTSSLANADPTSVADLRAGVENAWSGYQASRFGYTTTVLPRLLVGAQAAIREAETGEERREAQRMLALSYHAAAATLGKVGESELA
jgi:hypothetical protein